MGRKRIGVLAAVLALCTLAGPPARAHHSFAAAFDAESPITVSGVITEVRLENPHSWFFLDSTDADGAVTHWAFEAGTPTSIIRSGLKPGFVKAGDKVTIKGYHAWDASRNMGAARELAVEDGSRFAIGPSFGAR
jgi:hypothetical protein